MSQDSYADHVAKMLPEIHEIEEDAKAPLLPEDKDRGAKIALMSLIGLLCLVLFVVVIKDVVTIVIGVVSLAGLLGLFGGAMEIK